MTVNAEELYKLFWDLQKGVKYMNRMRNYIEIPVEDENTLQEYLDKYYN